MIKVAPLNQKAMPRSFPSNSSAQSTSVPDAQQAPPNSASPDSASPDSASPDTALTEAAPAATLPEANASANVLVVTHTAQGEISSLYWPQSSNCQNCEDLVGQSVAALFGPVAAPPYLARVQKVLATQEPEEFTCVVRCGHHPISFEFVLSSAASEPDRQCAPERAISDNRFGRSGGKCRRHWSPDCA